MYDKQTNSLWVHVTGKAEEGPLRGTQLKIIPSTVSTWRDWSQRHPDTLVLEGSKHDGFMGSYGAMTGRSQEIGLAVVLRGKAQLYPYTVLDSETLINNHLNNMPVLVVHNKAEMSTYVWSRYVAGQVLTFNQVRQENNSQDLVFTDRETRSLWSWIKGAAFDGPLEGTVLQQLPAHPIVVERFSAFYPEGDVFSP